MAFDLMDIHEETEPESLVLSEKAEDLIADYFAECARPDQRRAFEGGIIT